MLSSVPTVWQPLTHEQCHIFGVEVAQFFVFFTRFSFILFIDNLCVVCKACCSLLVNTSTSVGVGSLRVKRLKFFWAKHFFEIHNDLAILDKRRIRLFALFLQRRCIFSNCVVVVFLVTKFIIHIPIVGFVVRSLSFVRLRFLNRRCSSSRRIQKSADNILKRCSE